MKIVCTIPIFLSVLFILPACSTQEDATAEAPIRPVRYEQVSIAGEGRMRSFSGTAQASTESKISFKVGGTIKQVAIKVGDRVNKGNTIATLDTKDFELQMQQADASLQRSQAEERNANARYTRTRQLYETNSVSRNDLDAARAASESARASVKSAEKQLELVRRQLSYTKVSASGACSVATVNVEENENIQAGSIIAVLNCGDQKEVQVGVSEGFITRIHVGDACRVQFDALVGKVFAATVTEVGVSTSKSSSTFPITVVLDKPDPAVRTGMTAEVGFRIAGDGEQITVPAFAVGEDRQGRHVFVVTPGEQGLATVQRRAVSVGELTDKGILISHGLQDGELIVTAGVSRIIDGQTVRLPSLDGNK